MPQKTELTLGTSSLLGLILVGSSGLGSAAGHTSSVLLFSGGGTGDRRGSSTSDQ